MTELALALASNTAIALLLAAAAACAWRACHRPLLAHALALLGLLKLMTPPLLGPAVLTGSPAAGHAVLLETLRTGLAFGSPADATPSAAASPTLTQVLLGVWAIGSVATGLLAWRRHCRLRRLLDRLDSAPAVVRRSVDALAAELGLRHAPALRLTDGRVTPFVYALGRRPTLVLPRGLVAAPELRAVLAHELAHLAGRDHLVRWLELLVSVVHWWNPAAHALRAVLREVEEVRCDARAVAALDTSPKRYGRALLDVADRLDAPAVGAVGAHALIGGHPLQRRIAALAGGRLHGRLGGRGRTLVLALTAAVLPFGARTGSDGTTPDVTASPKSVRATDSVVVQLDDVTDSLAELPDVGKPGGLTALDDLTGLAELDLEFDIEVEAAPRLTDLREMEEHVRALRHEVRKWRGVVLRRAERAENGDWSVRVHSTDTEHRVTPRRLILVERSAEAAAGARALQSLHEFRVIRGRDREELRELRQSTRTTAR